MLNYNNVWAHILENKPFYSHLAMVGGFTIEESRVYYDKEFDKWGADPVFCITQCLRKYNINVGGDMQKDEYGFIRKYLNARGITIPFTRLEYQDYLRNIARSNMILSTLENVFMEDNIFVIPSVEAAASFFGIAYEFIMSLSSDLLLYSGSRARCIVDVYDSIVGFEVYKEGGSIFIPMYGSAKESVYFRQDIKKIKRSTPLTVFEDKGMSLPYHHSFVAVPFDTIEAVESISKYFMSFNIDSDSTEFIIAVAAAISGLFLGIGELPLIYSAVVFFPDSINI